MKKLILYLGCALFTGILIIGVIIFTSRNCDDNSNLPAEVFTTQTTEKTPYNK